MDGKDGDSRNIHRRDHKLQVDEVTQIIYKFPRANRDGSYSRERQLLEKLSSYDVAIRKAVRFRRFMCCHLLWSNWNKLLDRNILDDDIIRKYSSYDTSRPFSVTGAKSVGRFTRDEVK